MTLEGSRVLLRPWRAEDREPYVAIMADPAVQRYLTASTMDLDQIGRHVSAYSARFADQGWGFWAIEERESGTLIGMCGLDYVLWESFFTPAVQIAWRLGAAWQGQGLAREAAELALDYGFGSIGLDRIVAYTVPANTASWRLMERLGMRKIGAFDHPNLAEGNPLRRHVAYQITRAD